MKERNLSRKRMLVVALLALGLALLGLAAPSFGATVVVPNSLAAVEGVGNNGFPFNLGLFGRISMRYQQIFDASEFGALSAPELVTQIAFRPDAFSGRPFLSTLTNVQINLSTTTAEPDGLSTTFADNVGGDDTVVFSGSLSLTSADTGPVSGPKAFDIVINLQTPFFYDPGLGNLLLDVRNIGGGSTTQFDSHTVVADPASRLFSVTSNGVDDPTGSADTLGLIVQFTTIPAAIEVDIDIKFCSNPNGYNCKSRGVTPVTVFGRSDFDVDDVDISSLQLCLADLSQCTASPPKDSSVFDRGDPTTDIGAAQCALDPFGEELDWLNQDGFDDLDVTFHTQEVVSVIGCDGLNKNDASPTLVLIGQTTGGMPITSVPIGDAGIDQLLIKNK